MNDRPLSWLVIERGWSVTAADGSQVGRVHEVVGDENADIFDGLAVSTGALTRNIYVPAEHVGEITSGRIALLIGPGDVAGLEPYSAPPPSEEILSEGSSVWERIAGWVRGPRS
jgi:hypothetical protein